MADLVAMYAGKRPAWHGKGATNPQGWDSATDAGAETGLIDTEYALMPVEAVLPDGTRIDVPDRRAIVRGPIPGTMFRAEAIDTNEPLEVVGLNYELITPRRVCEILDTVSSRALLGDKAWPVETMGLIRRGRQMFVSMFIGTDTPFGNEGERTAFYLFCGQDFGGGKALSLVVTPVTVVCANTWAMAMENNAGNVRIAHRADATDRMQMTLAIQKAAAEGKAGAMEVFAALQRTQVDDVEVTRILEEIYPEPERPRRHAATDWKAVADDLRVRAMDRAERAIHLWEQAVARAHERRSFALSVYERYLDERTTGNTLYTLAGAVMECEDRRPGRNVTEGVLVGERRQIKQKAMTLITAKL